jgi:hypothetical protein
MDSQAPKKMGRPPVPNPRDTRVSTYLDEATNAKLVKMAQEESRSVADLIRRILTEALAQ